MNKFDSSEVTLTTTIIGFLIFPCLLLVCFLTAKISASKQEKIEQPNSILKYTAALQKEDPPTHIREILDSHIHIHSYCEMRRHVFRRCSDICNKPEKSAFEVCL